MTTAINNTPRLFISAPLKQEQDITLEDKQTHYLRNVMRMESGAKIRIFNGYDGEWLCEITNFSKKQTQITPRKQTLPQPKVTVPVHLIFAPIKKQRLDFLIEKAVELGVTHLHPVLTDHTKNRNIKIPRITAQIIEAAEQCERLFLPNLSPLTPLKQKVSLWANEHEETPNILWCAERDESAPHLKTIENPRTFLIGPEGGFSDEECLFLSAQPHIHPIHLGPQILRAETASIFCLTYVNN